MAGNHPKDPKPTPKRPPQPAVRTSTTPKTEPYFIKVKST